MTQAGLTDSAPPSARDRTHRLLVEAARAQLRDGGPMTVSAIAARSNVSRATAYRYFSNNEGVLLAATVPADQPKGFTADEALVELDAETPIVERISGLVRDTAKWAFEHETELRAVLALTLAPDSKRHGITRKGITNRASWVHDLLGALPPEIPTHARRRLEASLMPLFGADAVVWTTDVAEMSPDEAVEVLVWMARALTLATIMEFSSESPVAAAPAKKRTRARRSS
jgi:AcrR family transcriptional regulator